MIRVFVALSVVLGALVSPPSSDAGQAPADAQDPGLDEVLERLERAGRDLVDLRATVEYSVTQAIKEDEDDPDEVQTFEGSIKLQRQPEARFIIHLASWTDGRVLVDDDPKWYILDGTWLIEVRTKEERIIRQQLVEDGQVVDPFRLGEGLFPLPFGQTRADMISEFDMELLERTADNTDHIVGIPKPASDLSSRYSRVELFISHNPKTAGLPVRVVLHDFKDHTVKAVQFNSLKLNPGLEKSDFSVPHRARKWEQVEKRLGEGN